MIKIDAETLEVLDPEICHHAHHDTRLIRCTWPAGHGRSDGALLHHNDRLGITWVVDERRIYHVKLEVDLGLEQRGPDVIVLSMSRMLERVVRDLGADGIDWSTFRVSHKINPGLMRREIEYRVREATRGT